MKKSAVIALGTFWTMTGCMGMWEYSEPLVQSDSVAGAPASAQDLSASAAGDSPGRDAGAADDGADTDQIGASGADSGSDTDTRVEGVAGPAQEVNFIPPFPGAGAGVAPLAGNRVCDDVAGAAIHHVQQNTRCFYGIDSSEETREVVATVEQVLECVDGTDTVHLRLTLDPHFVDNTYGAGSIGWPEKRGHRFSDLVKSDHAELVVMDNDGEVALQFKMDLLSESASAPSGYDTLGVSGGDGSVTIGDAAHILSVKTSLAENLNVRGYGDYLVDSPLTNDLFESNPEAENWDYRHVYDVVIDVAAFGDAGFAGAFIDYVHASPAKSPSDTLEVIPGECPPCEDALDGSCGPYEEEDELPCGGPDQECEDTPTEEEPACGGLDVNCGDDEIPVEEPVDECGGLDVDCGTGPVEPSFCERYPTDSECNLI